ncbi:MAG: thiolase domain-containing protein [Thaumarchaeota archaeon]|nr:thiolase domain-containing protein [Nitrososphaerota archaeon]
MDAAVIGVGMTKFGRELEKQLPELAAEAVELALEDAGVDRRDIGYVALANVGGWSAEFFPYPIAAEYAGLIPKGGMRIEAACASGSAALHAAVMAVTSGYTDLALAIGVERMNELTTPQVVELLGRGGNFFWEFENFGLTFPAYYALFATAYMQEYGATEEDLAKIAVKNHYYGSMNPKAQFQKKITVDDVLNSRYVAWPLKLYDCSPITDGAAAAIVASEKIASKFTDTPIWIKAQGAASGTANLTMRKSLLSLESAVEAAKQAYAKAGVENPVKEFDFALVHDCFTIAEILAYEDLGFAKRGEGYKLAREEQTYIGGVIPVNLDGGLKAKGHPIGASGLGMVHEAVKQLRQEVEKGRQAPIRRGQALIHNIGGTGHFAYVTVLSLEKP